MHSVRDNVEWSSVSTFNDKDHISESNDSTTASIVLQRTIDWSKYENSGQLDPDSIGRLKDYDKQTIEDQNDLLDDQGAEYAKNFIVALKSIISENEVQYLLTMIYQLLITDKSRSQLFHNLVIVDKQLCSSEPYSILLRIMNRYVDPYTKHTSSHIIAIFFSTLPESYQKIESITTLIRDYLNSITIAIDHSDAILKSDLIGYLRSLMIVLVPSLSQNIFTTEQGISVLTRLLRTHDQNTQVMYQILYCFWLLSYNQHIIPRYRQHNLISLFFGILKSVSRVKVIRMCFAILRNLLDKEQYNEEMIDIGLLKLLPSFKNRKWDDEDIDEDINIIEDTLQNNIQILSTFESYQKQIRMSSLKWGVVHTEKFWRDHVYKFEQDKFEIIRQLVSLLDTYQSRGDNVETINNTLEIVCYDIGEFIRFHPNGKKIILTLKAKPLLMNLLQHPSSEVQKQALLALQKLLVRNWQVFDQKPFPN